MVRGHHSGHQPHAFSSNAWLAVIMITDVLDSPDRLNLPGATSNANWTWRMPICVDALFSHPSADIFPALLRETGRIP